MGTRGLIVFLGLLLTPQSLLADVAEEFLAHHVEARVDMADGSVRVAEATRVRVLGQKIKSAIGRAFPAPFKDTNKFEELMTTRGVVNEKGESKQESIPSLHYSQPNAFLVRFGDEKTVLAPGIYDYTFVYKLKDLVKVEDKLEGVTWDVTNFMTIPASDVVATFFLPPLVDPKTVKVQALIEGASEKDSKEVYREGGRVDVVVTRDSKEKTTLGEHAPKVVARVKDKLNENERLVVQIAWPVGFVNKVTPAPVPSQ